jgi:hypothetical protein
LRDLRCWVLLGIDGCVMLRVCGGEVKRRETPLLVGVFISVESKH